MIVSLLACSSHSSRSATCFLRYEAMDRARSVVSGMVAEQLLDHTDEEVVAELFETHQVALLQVGWDRAWSPGPHETQLDVQHNFQFSGSGEGRPVLIPADEIVVHVPFTGDPMLLRLKPSRWSNVLPHGEIRGNELVYRVTGQRLTPEQVTAAGPAEDAGSGGRPSASS
jgi:hypothetical protein